MGRAVAFMAPSPAADSFVAIAYVTGNAASRQDAEAIASLIGGGVRAGKMLLRPKLIDTGSLAAGGFAVVIAAVRAGLCAMAITSAPRVEIVVNHAVSAAAGIEFAAAFRMMIREI